MGENQIIRIGTRKSPLALWQAEHVSALIQKLRPRATVELVKIQTKGDKILDVPLARIGGKGLFIKEIEEQLLNGTVHLAVHSIKDMPYELPSGLVLGAVPPREDPRDVLIGRTAKTLDALPKNARVGTGSLRRKAQLLKLRPDLCVENIRGNVGTRLGKLESENLDAIVLAAAGVKRMELQARVTQYFEPDQMLPAVGQGALGIEVREDDSETLALVGQLNDPETRLIVEAERRFLALMEGSCQIPVAAHGRLKGTSFSITGMVADLCGAPLYRETQAGSRDQANELAEKAAQKLLDRGGREILDKLNALEPVVH